MLKELRSWFQMLDGIEDGTNTLERADSAPAAELQHGVCGTLAPSRSLTFVVDKDAGSAKILAATLSASGVDAVVFHDAAALAAGLARSAPDMIFLDVSTHGEQAIDALYTLGQGAFGGAVQLIGAQMTPVVEAVRRMGSRHSLNMLTPLARPLSAATIRRVLREQKLSTQGAGPVVELGEALANDWLEFWYQPKIDLKKRQIAGVETFARVRHPQMGMLQPGDFVPGAPEEHLIAMSERALLAALRAASNFSQLGIVLRLAVNMPVSGMLGLPVRQMVQEFGPKHQKWPGLLLDVTEAQITQNLAEVQAVSRGLTACGTSLAIDDFSGVGLSLAALRGLPIAELKLDRALVSDCAVNLERSSQCRSVIDLSHLLGCVTVGIGIEKAADMMVLQGMGCDLGQGYFFGQPMPEATLISMMLQRAVAAPPRMPAKPLTPTRAAASAMTRARLN